MSDLCFWMKIILTALYSFCISAMSIARAWTHTPRRIAVHAARMRFSRSRSVTEGTHHGNDETGSSQGPEAIAWYTLTPSTLFGGSFLRIISTSAAGRSSTEQ